MSTQTNKIEVIAEPGSTAVTMIRTFDHPREKVFRAMTETELVAKWWGRGNPLKVIEHEPRRGGRWSFVEQTEDGDFGFSGVYHDVVENERIIQTFEFAGAPHEAMIENLRLEDTADGGTRITVAAAHPSAEVVAQMLESGMTEGAEQSYQALDAVLNAL